MRANLKDRTRPELAVRSALHRRGLRFRTTLAIAASTVTVRPDLVFTKSRVAVFMDGCFWHSCPSHGTRPEHNSGYWLPKLERTVRRDDLVTIALRENGWTVIRLWEHDVLSDFDTSIDLVVSAVKGH